MKKNRRGVLITALTLVLGLAVLSTTIVAPQMRAVQSFAYVAEEAQTLEAMAAAAAQGTAVHAMQSPAHIDLRTQERVSQPFFAEVLEHIKVNGVPDTSPDPGMRKPWADGVLLDVLSSSNTPSGLARDESLPNIDIVVPGSEGSYVFTLSNIDSHACDYLFTIREGPNAPDNYLDFPIQYRLDGGGWMFLDDLKQQEFTGIVDAGATREFLLEWKWDYFMCDAQDQVDTALGMATELYQLQLNIIVAADEFDIYIILEPGEGGSVVPDRIRYRRGDNYGILPIPTRPGYTFVGWVDENGNPIDPNAEIPPNGGRVFAVWEENPPDDCKIPKWPLLVIPLIPAALIPPLLAIIPASIAALLIGTVVICWLCNHNQCECEPCDDDDDICDVTDIPEPKDPDDVDFVMPPKTGDSTVIALGALALLTLSGAAALLLRRKRQEEE